MGNRISDCFSRLKLRHRTALICFMTAGDPNYDISCDILDLLPSAGADLIELGMPFSDPMADGPTIQASSKRSLENGHKMARTFSMVSRFRDHDSQTPIILMGYYNPIYFYGVSRFIEDACSVGVDGLIIVDLPPELDSELCLPSRSAGLDFIRLAAPTTDLVRLPNIIKNMSGFLYYISVSGVTGVKSPDMGLVSRHIDEIRAYSGSIPIAVGFGVKTPLQAREISSFADGVVVGSSLVHMIWESFSSSGRDGVLARIREQVCSFHDVLGGDFKEDGHDMTGYEER